MGEYLRAKCEVSSLILTSFRQEWGGMGVGGGETTPPPTSISKQTPKKPSEIRVKIFLVHVMT